MNTKNKQDYIKELFINDLKKMDSAGSHVKKADLLAIAEEYGLNVKSREAKVSIVDKIIKAGFYERLYQDFQEFIYVPSWEVGKFYNLKNEEINQLKFIGIITEDIKKESFYSKDIKSEVFYNSYPLTVFNYDVEELNKAYELAFNRARYKLRVETKTTEEVSRITEELKKTFIVVGDKPDIYPHRNQEGYYSYYSVDLLNNSNYEGNRLLKEIDSLKAEIKQIKEDNREEVKSINKKWCEATGFKSFLEAKNIERIEEYYKNKIEQLISENNSIENSTKINNERGAGRKELFTEGDKELIKMYRLQGHTMKDLAKMFKCSVGLIHKLINEDN